MKKTLVILTCALGASGAFTTSGAFAQAAPAPAPVATASGSASTSGGSGATPREARVEQRIASLHSQLKITPAQEGQWNAFAEVMRENGATMGDRYRQRAATAKSQSALDNMTQYADLAQAHADGVKKLVTAFEPLYNSLSPEQKKLADAAFREGMGGEHQHRTRGKKEEKTVQP
jgi:periplasmic protein CpxP/Spy